MVLRPSLSSGGPNVPGFVWLLRLNGTPRNPFPILSIEIERLRAIMELVFRSVPLGRNSGLDSTIPNAIRLHLFESPLHPLPPTGDARRVLTPRHFPRSEVRVKHGGSA